MSLKENQRRSNMKIQCKKCYSYFENESDECPYCGARVVSQPTGSSSAVSENSGRTEIGFCRYCGAKLESDAQFCMKCGKPIEKNESYKAEYSAGYHATYEATNFVMRFLKQFGYINDAIRKIGVLSAVVLAVIQIFGMKYAIIETIWQRKEEEYNGNVIKTLYLFLTKETEICSSIEQHIFLWWICFIALIIANIVLLITCVSTIHTIVSKYHIDSVIDVIKAMSTCAIVVFGAAILIGLFINGKLEEVTYYTLNVNVFNYIALIYAVILRIMSGMIIRSQLERE